MNDGSSPKPARIGNYWTFITLIAFLAGVGGGFILGYRRHANTSKHDPAAMGDLANQVNPPEGFAIAARFGEIGPKMLKAGSMDLNAFE